ncbi:MAG: cysteine synthase A [Clostridia bacterium]|nr:cysteine synthase A [Clostridia bacterium]
MKVFTDIAELIGHTPLFEPKNLEKIHNAKARVFCKLEYLNPAGSIKDRAALSMIEDAERRGLLKGDSVIIEATSGNTGIGLAAIAAARGYRVILTMPENMSSERIKLLSAYGAEVVLTHAAEGTTGAVKKAEELAKSTPNSFIAGQFENTANAQAHINTTGPEIYEDLDGRIDILVAGVGTGGTITGLAQYFAQKNTNTKIVAVEPASSPLLSEGRAGSHGIQGIGANFVPSLLDTSFIDQIVTVTEEEAYMAARELAKKEGILTGISSGAALHVALNLSSLPKNEGKNIVVILPDTGDRYLSTPLYNN